jgi:hypothetical protein
LTLYMTGMPAWPPEKTTLSISVVATARSLAPVAGSGMPLL